MKAYTNFSNDISQLGTDVNVYSNADTNKEVKLVDYTRDLEKGQIIILLSSLLFSDNKVKIYIRDNKMAVIVTEVVDTTYSPTSFVTDWQRFTKQTYERMHNLNLVLPGDNFYLLRHYVLPEKYLLKIILGKTIVN